MSLPYRQLLSQQAPEGDNSTLVSYSKTIVEQLQLLPLFVILEQLNLSRDLVPSIVEVASFMEKLDKLRQSHVPIRSHGGRSSLRRQDQDSNEQHWFSLGDFASQLNTCELVSTIWITASIRCCSAPSSPIASHRREAGPGCNARDSPYSTARPFRCRCSDGRPLLYIAQILH
jgi:hypothetical protein